MNSVFVEFPSLQTDYYQTSQQANAILSGPETWDNLGLQMVVVDLVHGLPLPDLVFVSGEENKASRTLELDVEAAGSSIQEALFGF